MYLCRSRCILALSVQLAILRASCRPSVGQSIAEVLHVLYSQDFIE